MKCPRCGTTQGKKSGGTCLSCGRTYVFFPPTREITDQKMRVRLDKLTRGNTYAFTPRQLESLWVRLQHRSMGGAGLFSLLFKSVFAAVFVSVFLTIVWPSASQPLVIGLVASVLVGLGLVRQWLPPKATPEPGVRGWLARWQSSEPNALLVEHPSLGQPPAEAGNPQFDHGVERLLIVDRDELVDFFVKSGFHAEQRCLVVSMSGYPAYLKDRAQQVISGTDRPVFLLHGTARSGESMARDGAFDLQPGRAVDLGLSWATVAKHAGLSRMVESGAEQIEVDHLLPMELVGGVALCMDRSAPLTSVTDEEAQPRSDFGMFLLVDAFG